MLPPDFPHTSVMLQEAVTALNPTSGRLYVDATIGAGGHALEILKASLPAGKLIGFDRDPLSMALTQKRLQAIAADRIKLILAPYSQLQQHLSLCEITGGVLADLGFATYQVAQASRGFSFLHDAPLDMRFNPEDDTQPTAAHLLASASEAHLLQWFRDFGEDPLAPIIARAIVNDRDKTPFETTHQLASLVSRVSRAHYKSASRTHPATRVFQALRIAVNQEFEHLEALLDALPSCCASGARVAIITFHSLEDRLVKRRFRQWENPCVCPSAFPLCSCGRPAQWRRLKPNLILPSAHEVSINPNARSAKLRVIEKL
ncbi:MAG: 16S rRNA (cytosine(1402)-N(4))-methyltransferase RsmH [Vampirovibrionales bacterium]|nr:16S rRNA (cytosine(1402)-N(4))-methyltransferase RsmH [Vampirovibrionales bacterium]